VYAKNQSRIVSLRDLMKEFGVYELASRLETLGAANATLKNADAAGIRVCNDGFLDLLGKVFEGLQSACENMGADSTLIVQLKMLSTTFADHSADNREASITAQINGIIEAIHHNISKKKFMLLSEDEATFYSNFKLFGESFQDKYSFNALRESLGAGNCYAAGEYTACVFHCMRVAEYGLRKLAANRTLRVKLTKNHRPIPIEYGTWQDVITAIQNKIKKIRQRPVGPKREAELQFFSSAADHCEYMKDIWRNELSHTRRWYKKEEALSAINRVKEFVTVIGEHKGSPIAGDTISKLIDQVIEREKAKSAAALVSAKQILGNPKA
jgi:hypothetical protein